MTSKRLLLLGGLLALAAGVGLYVGCSGQVSTTTGDGGNGGKDSSANVTYDSGSSAKCPQGQDKDGDGYGQNCAAGADCDDADPNKHPGAQEICDTKDNNCDGKVDENLTNCKANAIGVGKPFPIDPSKDKNVKEATGVKLDKNGDLIIGSNLANLGFLWIANTDDLGRGTLSKVDTKNFKEVGRYNTFTCKSKPGAPGCVDANGEAIKPNIPRLPSRTAVDFNMDVWVANRCMGGCQPSATKVANESSNCIDRNNNNKIDTSADRDGDGKITTDCDGDGKPDTLASKCKNGKQPEFLGDDDECILFTVNYGDPGDIARSICLDAGKANIGASNAWVGTYSRPENNRGNNLYFKINGNTGTIDQTIKLPKEHHAYGCTADGHNLVWSTDVGHYAHSQHGSLTYFQTIHPYQVGVVLRGPSASAPWKDRKKKRYRHYGIAVDSTQSIWLGGIDSEWVLRYRPNRASFATLAAGKWTRIDLPRGFQSRGVAPDNRGKVWVAVDAGHILRIEENIAEGIHDFTKIQLGKDYWTTTAKGVIGVGVDIDGHLWGVGRTNNMASRIGVDAKGNVVQATSKNVGVGLHPYTYSDFTGFGLRTFVRPEGRWSYEHKSCPEGKKATWQQVTWNATTPAGTSVTLRVRTGESTATFGNWSKPFSKSPADFGPKSAAPIRPNPATLMQVEFTLANPAKKATPTLHDYAIVYNCIGGVN